jgi:YD repeat-containing protein
MEFYTAFQQDFRQGTQERESLYLGRGILGFVRALVVLLALACAPALAATSLYVYDELGRLTAEIDPAGETTIYTYDAAGNLLSVLRGASSQFRVISFAPTRGKAGDTVTIFGSGFIADPAQNTVSFNGTPAAITSATSSSLVVTAPAGVTTGPIAVSNANGSAVTAQAFTVIFPPVINAVTPTAVRRGAATRIAISGDQLSTARAVSFDQPGITTRIVPGATPTTLSVDVTVAGTVPLGAYAFSVTNDAGTTASGTVTVSVTTDLLGDVMTLTRPLSVQLRAAEPNAPPGNALSVTRSAVSVHLPAPISGGPGDTLSVTPSPVSVHLLAPASGPAGNAMTVTQPLSVSLP